MDAGSQQSPLDVRLRQYQALFEVAQSIAVHRDLPSLLQDMNQRLQQVVKFDGINVVLYDSKRHLMRMHLLESATLSRERLFAELTVEEAASGWVWQTQQPMLMADLDAFQDRFPRVVTELRQMGVKTAYILPLTSVGRRLGAIGFASLEEIAWNEADLELLQQVAKLVAVAVDNAINSENATATETELKGLLDQRRLLLDVGKSIVSHLDLKEVVNTVSASLRDIIPHDAAGIALYEPESNLLREYTNITYKDMSPFRVGEVIPLEGTPAGQVFNTGQPLLIRRRDQERFPADNLAQRRGEDRPNSACLVPLVSHGRKLGIVGVSSTQEGRFTERDLELLAQIAGPIAIAVENALNFDRARQAEQTLSRKLEHLRLILEITTALVSQLDLWELLRIVTSNVRRVMGSDTVGVALFDHESGQLRAFAADVPPDHPFREKGAPIPMDDNPAALAFTSGQPVFIDKPDFDKFKSDLLRRLHDDGYRSGGSIPLIAQGRKLGVLGVSSKREYAFSPDDKDLLCQVANQVAIAVDNALNFERARAAEQQAKRQSERLQLLLEINNAVASQLSLRELLRLISSCLRQALQPDITAISLYDPETNQFRAYMFDLPDNLPPIEEGTPMPLEGTVGGMAFISGRPVFMSRPDPEVSTHEFDRRLIDAGIKSGGVVPMIVQDRKLGFLGVGSFREDAFSEADQELLSHIANQMAIAVDNSLNFERARAAEKKAQYQSDRLGLLLRINNAVVSHLDLRELLRAIFRSLHEVVHHDAAAILIYDHELNKLRMLMTDVPEMPPIFEESRLVGLEGSGAGLAFTSGQPVFFDRFDLEKFPSEFTRRAYDAGIRSTGNIPLVTHGRKLGILSVGKLREGAFAEDEIELLCQSSNQVAIALENALAFGEIEALKNKLASEKLYLEDEIRTQHNFDELVGESQTFRRILRQVETVAPTETTVLVCGETGTGKELIARAIHDLSSRRERTLVKVNCAAIPTGLLESEIFGHEKGAFTGAISQRVGRFELANRGTLFLDEVGDIPLELQPKLLRVIQEQEFERLGSTRTQKVDVRMIAATNCDLEQMVADKKYRSDLYYRLNVFPITIPPLRDRREDIPSLTRFFAQKFARRLKKQITTIPSESMSALVNYHWPGNIRELEHFIERAVVLSQGPDLEISLSELKPPVSATSATPATTAATSNISTLEAAEREHILRALEETDWVVGGPKGAAARLGMKRTTLQSRMQKLGIERSQS